MRHASDRLEETFGENREPLVIVVTINPNNFSEDPYRFELLPDGLWAYAAGGDPFTVAEIDRLRNEHLG
ncbi:MAG TPA: hypothetical protein VLD83_17075 [Candidatus Binatia bacterium]|nr:hypothetical protein [Candidatus Binatia bacterium]